MDWEPVDSSHVKAVRYDSAMAELGIRFADGSEHTYQNVPRQMHEALLASDSPGSFFHRHIKNNYRHERA